MLHKVKEIFKQILTTQPKYNNEFANIKQYLAEVCADLAELKTSHRLGFLQNDSLGLKLVSCIVFELLPHDFRREVIHRAENNYTTLNDVFELSNEAIRTIAKTKRFIFLGNSKNKNDSTVNKVLEQPNRISPVV